MANVIGALFYYEVAGEGRPMVEGFYSHHEDLRGLLNSLEVGRVHLVGCSMGGGAVLDLALRHPERVGALVLVGSAVSEFEGDFEPPGQWDELVAVDEVGDLGRGSELEVQIWVDGPRRRPEDGGGVVPELVCEMNLMALHNEA